LICVEPCMKSKVGIGVVCVATERAETVDTNGTSVVNVYRAPQAAGVPVGIDDIGVLERAGDVALRRALALRRARHLNGKHVVCSQSRQIGDVEGVGKEVALWVAEVRAIEPYVSLIEDSVEGDEPAATIGGWSEIELASIQEGAVVRAERGSVAPMAGDFDDWPGGVVEVEPDAVASDIVIGALRPP